jgi:hypothetical protein
VAPCLLGLGTGWRWVDGFVPGVGVLGAPWMRGWVGPGAGLGAVAKREKPHHFPCRELSPGRPARGHVSVAAELFRSLIGSSGWLFLTVQ